MTTATVTFDLDVLNPIFDFVLPKVKEDDREEIKHDSIVRILTAIRDNKIKSDLFTFSHTVIRRTVTDYYRKKGNMINSNSTSVNFCDGADEDQGSTVDYFSYETREVGYDMSDVRNSYLVNIGEFTKQERKIVDYMLFTEDGMDMKPTEIANLLGIHKSHASRAMKTLKRVCQA